MPHSICGDCSTFMAGSYGNVKGEYNLVVLSKPVKSQNSRAMNEFHLEYNSHIFFSREVLKHDERSKEISKCAFFIQ